MSERIRLYNDVPERIDFVLGFGFRINYRKLLEELSGEEESRALEVLRIQLRKYETILRDDTLAVC